MENRSYPVEISDKSTSVIVIEQTGDESPVYDLIENHRELLANQVHAKITNTRGHTTCELHISHPGHNVERLSKIDLLFCGSKQRVASNTFMLHFDNEGRCELAPITTLYRLTQEFGGAEELEAPSAGKSGATSNNDDLHARPVESLGFDELQRELQQLARTEPEDYSKDHKKWKNRYTKVKRRLRELKHDNCGDQMESGSEFEESSSSGSEIDSSSELSESDSETENGRSHTRTPTTQILQQNSRSIRDFIHALEQAGNRSRVSQGTFRTAFNNRDEKIKNLNIEEFIDAVICELEADGSVALNAENGDIMILKKR